MNEIKNKGKRMIFHIEFKKPKNSPIGYIDNDKMWYNRLPKILPPFVLKSVKVIKNNENEIEKVKLVVYLDKN